MSFTFSSLPCGFLEPATTITQSHQPIISRGSVYCGKDFWSRSAAWFASQQKMQLEQRKQQNAQAGKKTKTHRWASTTAPTRIQPSRAAKTKIANKRKADDIEDINDNNDVPVVYKKAKTSQVIAVEEDYTLDPGFASMSVHTFQEKMDTLLEGKRATLFRSCFWSTAISSPPTPSTATCVNHWCPIVAAPLACNAMKYCSHGMSRFLPSSLSTPQSSCPVAVMTPPRTPIVAMGPPPRPCSTLLTPTTPPPMASFRFQAKPHVEQQHIQARAVEFAGLRFAVDICNGMLRVYMV
ncbi:hypothetical protein SEUCBS139899_005325 [Sporothrix eucalyptigena]